MNEYNTAFTKYNDEANKLDENLNGENQRLRQFLEDENFEQDWKIIRKSIVYITIF